MPLAALSGKGDRLTPPWPQLIVACGRRSIDIALTVKRLSGGETIAAYVQNPKRAAPGFDLVVAMRHDGISGPNVILSDTALHPVTPEKLAAARAAWQGRLGPAGDGPLIGVLVGGDNASYRLTPAIAERLVRVLAKAHRSRGARAIVTTSRRTPEAARRALAEGLAGKPWAALWDGSGDNPYLGILALADRLLVTGNSVSMVSEALAAGCPVHVLRPEGYSRRHEIFLARLAADGFTSLIEGEALDVTFAGRGPVDATPDAAERLRAMLGAPLR